MIYQQKVELVTAAWPRDRYIELVTRLVLNCQGSAFQKLQLHQSELLTNDRSSVERLIELLGGSWGRIPLEKQFDEAEQALFHCSQKTDESNDSYLARADILWSKLLARKLKMEDLQAFIVLRGSTLSSEDKKRVILESDKDKEGTLTMKRVSESIRLLGASFFMDVTGQRKARTKVYDQATLVAEASQDLSADGLVTVEETTEEDFLEALIAEGEDEDALMIHDFENAASDAVQEDPDLAQAYTAYTEARRRLSEKFRNRGFFPTSNKGSSSKGKGYGKIGKGKGRRPRKTLQERIMSSTCNACFRKGHWKAECPYRNANDGSTSGTTAPGSSMPVTTVTVETQDPVDCLPMEFLSIPEAEKTLDEPCHTVMSVFWADTIEDTRGKSIYKERIKRYRDRIIHDSRGDISKYKFSNSAALTHRRDHRLRNERISTVSDFDLHRSHLSEVHSPGTIVINPDLQIESTEIPLKGSSSKESMLCFATHDSSGIVDLGASKTVIGDEHLTSLIQNLDPTVREKLRRCPCRITFRFGNQGTLTSSQALVIPIGKFHLKVAIVKGETPFLLSNTLMRALHASIHCHDQTLTSPMLGTAVKLRLSSRGLFLMDLNDLIQAGQFSVSADTSSASGTLHETFVSEEVEKKLTETEATPSQPCNPDLNKVNPNVNQVELQKVSTEIQPSSVKCAVAMTCKDSNDDRMFSSGPAQEHLDKGTRSEDSHHVIVEHSPAPTADSDCCGSRGSQSSHHGRTGPGDHHVREQASGEDFPRSLDRPRMGPFHGRSLLEEHQTGPSTIPEVRGTEGPRSRATPDAHPSDSSRQCTDTGKHGQGQKCRHDAQGQGPSALARHGCRMGSGHRAWTTRDVCLSDYELSPSRSNRDGGQHATAHATHGVSADPSDPTSGDAFLEQSADGRWPSRRFLGLKEDWEAEANITQTETDNHLKRLIRQYEQELRNAINNTKPLGKPCALMEVFCSEKSPLTHQVQQLGRAAYRYGYSEGDLSTSEGRTRLFSWIARYRPNDVWISPDCGPWSSWSRLNASRSLESQQAYETTRHQLMYQIAICIVLFRHQVSHDRHFHMEQPARSLMLTQAGMSEIHAYTRACQFDMCRLGDLKCPLNGMPMKKSMIVLTTSQQMFEQLHGKTCSRNHDHQPIEGTTLAKEGPIARTEYTAIYPRKFARLIARTLTKPQKIIHAIYVASTETALPAVARSSRVRRLAAQFERTELVTPESQSSHDTKRRRLDGKQTVTNSLESYQEVMNRINQMLPRVGKININNPEVIQQLQQLFPDKRIVHVIGCRGTDRTLAPPDRMHADEAPFRRSLIILRSTGEVKFEKYWEKWTQLSKRQLIRPAHACRINVTMFAKDDRLTHDIATTPGSSSNSEARPSVPESSVPVEPMPSQNQTTDTTMGSEAVPTPTSATDSKQQATEIKAQDQDLTFKSLPKWEQNQILTMHKNLGHPSNDRLAKALQVAKFRPEMVQAAQGLKCSICASCSPPKHQRPGSLKTMLDFNAKIYLDGITWSNDKGKQFHFYHILDAGSNFHVAIGSPSKHTEDLINLINQHWISWAGPPTELQVDSGTELNSEKFSEFTQRFNIRQYTTCPEAHWQQGKIERHGGFLESMLTKIDKEYPINDYATLQIALNQSTHAKNSLSIRHGYAPEVIVFGKHTRLPGSVLSDDSIPSHEMALREDSDLQPNEFRQLLLIREIARRAFHASDNNDAIRRAMLRRPCPNRGQYQPGQWVMIWRAEQLRPTGWMGPHKVILQDGQQTVWTTQGGKLYRSAPEHVRLALPEEGQSESCELPENLTAIQHQIENMSRNNTLSSSNSEPIPLETIQENLQFPDTEVNIPTTEAEHDVTRTSSSAETVPQPDQEPEGSRQLTPNVVDQSDAHIPETDETVQLLCEDVDWTLTADNPDHDLAWRCEFDVTIPEGQQVPTDQNDSWIMLATSAKKQRTEVRLSELTPTEKQEFEKAKMAEVQNWIQTGTLTKVLRNQIPEEQILKCRWILTWKPLDNVGNVIDPNSPSHVEVRTHKAKARLVVLGYLDPNIENIPRDSPTLNRTSKMLLLQIIASCGWMLESFDIKAAFLQGQPQSDRIMAIEPVPELRKAMNMTSQEVGKLNKGAYGLIDAPFLWYCALVSELLKLGFETSPFDPCLFVLRVPNGEPNAGALSGILGIHVDDGIGGGDHRFHEKVKQLEAKFPFGSHKTSAFTFTGIEVTQQGDKSIHMSQSAYVRKIQPISIDPNRKTLETEKVTEKERLALRGLIGSLQYAATNTRPDLSSKLSFLQSSINTATISTLIEGNRLLHEAKRYHDVSIVLKPIPLKDFRFMAFSDASFASNKKPDSHAGIIIVGTHKEISNNKQCPISPITWGCKKIQRVVTSTLAAETTSLAAAIDQLAWLRLFWSWLHDPSTEWRNPEETLKTIAPAITAPTFKETADLAITDCKSLYDLTTRTAPPSCSEFRVQLVSRAIKEALQEGIQLRWVHSGAQLADALTKAMEAHFLRTTLKLGSYRLVDEDATLKERAKTKDRVKWLKEQQNINKKENLGVWFCHMKHPLLHSFQQPATCHVRSIHQIHSMTSDRHKAQVCQWRVEEVACLRAIGLVRLGIAHGRGRPISCLWNRDSTTSLSCREKRISVGTLGHRLRLVLPQLHSYIYIYYRINIYN